MVNHMRGSNSEPKSSVEVGFATDVTRGSFFSPSFLSPRKEPLEPG